jgi:endonuclease YncB( thermonuclease family)
MTVYAARLLSHHDGDTCTVTVTLREQDIGLGIVAGGHIDQTLRYCGVNAPELGTTAGREALKFVAAALPAQTNFQIVTSKRDARGKYGRLLAWLILPSGDVLNQQLVESGNAVAYPPLPLVPPDSDINVPIITTKPVPAASVLSA